jgi:hypothetical protein
MLLVIKLWAEFGMSKVVNFSSKSKIIILTFKYLIMNTLIEIAK